MVASNGYINATISYAVKNNQDKVLEWFNISSHDFIYNWLKNKGDK